MNETWLKYTKKYEGLNLYPYPCPAGHLTIGYGHNLENGITRQAAEFVLRQDMAHAAKQVRGKFPWFDRLSEARQFVLVDMCFNMGLSKLCTFKKMLLCVQKEAWEQASFEMIHSRWAGQVGRRARELAGMMKTGVYEHENCN